MYELRIRLNCIPTIPAADLPAAINRSEARLARLAHGSEIAYNQEVTYLLALERAAAEAAA